MHFPSNSIPLPIPKGNQYLECWVYVPFTFQIVSVINIYISRFWSVCPMLNCSVVSDSLRLHGLSTVAHQAPLSMGVLQARMLEWVPIPSSRGSSWPRERTQVSCIAGGFFTSWATREVLWHVQHDFIIFMVCNLLFSFKVIFFKFIVLHVAIICSSSRLHDFSLSAYIAVYLNSVT